jgi:hypothetical protein
MKNPKDGESGRKTRKGGKWPWKAALALLPWLGPSGGHALEVHEWGTFTTLNSSAGNGLSGLFVDASRLPAFVHGLPYFNYDPVKGWASPDKLRNVTVKMETPVLYFYSNKEIDVDVKVKFQGGTISQWYPQCYDCEANPSAPSVDFAKEPYLGHIAWKAKVLAPGPELPYTTAALGGETGEWIAPRGTLANQLRGQQGEIEKFLFYRGLGNFPSPLQLAFKNPATLVVHNTGDEDIPWVMIYDRQGDLGYPASIWFQGPLKAHANVEAGKQDGFPGYDPGTAAMDTLYNHLVAAGLSTQEARALLNTWYNGYFVEGGLKAFWILPRAQVDRILPLEITPVPDKIVRVIVGRSEILAPAFEENLYKAKADGSLDAKYGTDKYFLAYRDFLAKGQDWHLATSVRPDRSRFSVRDAAESTWKGPGQEGGGASPRFSAPGGNPGSIAVDLRGRVVRPAYPTGR